MIYDILVILKVIKMTMDEMDDIKHYKTEVEMEEERVLLGF